LSSSQAIIAIAAAITMGMPPTSATFDRMRINPPLRAQAPDPAGGAGLRAP
jgi:hypothetical protein